MPTDTPTWDETEAVEAAPTWDETEPVEAKLPSPGDELKLYEKMRQQQAAYDPYESQRGLTRLTTGIQQDIAPAGKVLHEAGQFISKQAKAATLEYTGQPEEAERESMSPYGQGPWEEGKRALPAPARALSSGTEGLIESTPQLAAVAGGELLGIPAPVSAAAVFGTTPEGFDVKQAAIGALLPEVGKYTGALTEAVASRLGVSTPQALSIINRAGGAGGAAALIGADQLNTIRQLPPEKRGEAFADAAGNVLSMAWLGMMGEHPSPDRPARVAAAQIGRAAREVPTPESFRDFGQPLPPPISETGAPPPAFPGIPRRPPEIPQPKRNQPVEVPGTPAEPYETAVQTIRRAGADTIAKIQALFPNANLNRERARELRNAAFPQNQPQPTTENASSIPPPTEIHGNVRPQPRQGQGQVSIEESRAGIQPPPETPESEIPLTESTDPTAQAIATSWVKNAWEKLRPSRELPMEELQRRVEEAEAARDQHKPNSPEWQKADEQAREARNQYGAADSTEHRINMLKNDIARLWRESGRQDSIDKYTDEQLPQKYGRPLNREEIEDELHKLRDSMEPSKPKNLGEAEPAKPVTNKGAETLAKPANRPIPTLEEATAQKLPTPARDAIIEYNVLQKIIETGKTANGQTPGPQEMAGFRKRQKQVVRNFHHAIENGGKGEAPPDFVSSADAREIHFLKLRVERLLASRGDLKTWGDDLLADAKKRLGRPLTADEMKQELESAVARLESGEEPPAQSGETRPIPTIEEAKAANIPSRASFLITQYDVYKDVLDTGKHSNGQKVTPKDRQDLERRLEKIVRDFYYNLERTPKNNTLGEQTPHSAPADYQPTTTDWRSIKPTPDQEPEGGWPQPNQHGVYDEDQAEKLRLNRAKSKTAIWVMQTAKGWIAAGEFQHNSGKHTGFSEPLTTRQTFPTREQAIAHFANVLIGRQMDVLRISDLHPTQKIEAQHIIAWAKEQIAKAGAAAPEKEPHPATTGPTTRETPSREEIGDRPGAAPPAISPGLARARAIAGGEQIKAGFTNDALKAGASLDPDHPEELEELQRLEAQAKAELKDAIAKQDFNAMQALGSKKQWFTEAIQAATGLEERDVARQILGPDYKPPFPGGKPREKSVAPSAEVRQKEAGEIGRTEPATTESGGVEPPATPKSSTGETPNAPAGAGRVGNAPPPGTRPAAETVGTEREEAGRGAGVAAGQTGDTGTREPSDTGTGVVPGGGGAAESTTGVIFKQGERVQWHTPYGFYTGTVESYYAPGKSYTIIGSGGARHVGVDAANVKPEGVPNPDAEIAAAEAKARLADANFDRLGKWVDQKTKFQRDRWTKAKTDSIKAQSELAKLLEAKKQAAKKPAEPKPSTAAELESALKTDLPDVEKSKQADSFAHEKFKEFQEQEKELLTKYHELENKIMTGSRYNRRIKKAAKKADVEEYKKVEKEIQKIRDQARAIEDSVRKDRLALELANYARRANDQSQPLASRIGAKINWYAVRGEPVPKELSSEMAKHAKAEILKRFPDATPEEVKTMSNEVERSIRLGVDIDREFQFNPGLKLHEARSRELAKILNAPGNEVGNFSEELTQDISRFASTGRVASINTEKLSAADLERLKKRISEETTGIQQRRQELEAKREQERQEAEAKEAQLIQEAQAVADSAPKTGTAGGRSAKEVRDELVRRIESAITDLVNARNIKLQQGKEGDYAATDPDGSTAAFGDIEPTSNGKFKVSASRTGKKEDVVSAIVPSKEQAEWFIKAMAAEGVGHAIIGVPGDGVFRLVKSGRHLLNVWKDARAIDVHGGQKTTPYSSSTATIKPPDVIKTVAQWEDAKDFFELKPTDTIADRSNALKAVAEGLSQKINKPANQITTFDMDQWAKSVSEKKPSGQVKAFGGGTRGMPPPSGPAASLQLNIPTVAQTAQQLVTLKNNLTPGLSGIQSLLLPSSLSKAHLTEAERLGSFLGPMHRAAEIANTALKAASKYFDKQGVHRDDLPPAQNPGLQFMSAMSTGAALPAHLQGFATQIQRFFIQRLRQLEAAGAPLETIRQNYFPGMWTRESREAFNAALDLAFQQGIIPPNSDLNNATPAQKAWVKAKADQFIDAGQGSDVDMLGYLTRRPLAGRESFRKPKVFDDIMTGAEFGLRPVSYNPIDVVKLKLAEMDRSIMAHREFQSLKAAGKLQIINPYEEVPEGWQKVNDKYGTIYGAPTTKINEYVDKEMYNDLLDFAASIGVRHTRSLTFPPGPGQRALGLSYTGRSAIRTRFATPMNVLAHEIGHQLDEKYGLWDYMTHGEKGNERSVWQKELRAIADLTGRNKAYTRQREEKIAQMVEGYIYAKERMVAVAPTVFTTFDSFIRGTQALKKFADIKPGLAHEKLTAEKYVGLPIMGYRIVPNEAADILNNYLSSSLYNNRYFGGLYRGWIGAANALNQTQLGMGSMFHAGFTTGEAQVSAGANFIKDIYGVARGNRSLPDLANTAKDWATAAVNTFFVGDKVLDAWRNPQGAMDPKIANVVRAGELAGGAFKFEHAMTTEQLPKMVRDWYAGNKVKAAIRSPIALTELMSKPVMEWIVPRQKAGVFAALANRIIEQNPGVPLEQLTPEFRQAWNRTDARLGQVRYDRLFANNTAKNVIQGLVRAPGWTGGTIAEIGGAFPDTAKFLHEWITTGRLPENIPDRTAYLLSLLVTVGAANAVLTYAFTGQMPHGMDFMAFRDGTKDQYGNENRFLLPSYMKDILAYAIRPGTTLANKAHPALGVIGDVLNNRNYYGYEVYDPHASFPRQQAQKVGYVLKSFEPFWTRGARKAHQQGSGIAQQASSFFGVMPAPGYITMTSIQREIADLYHKRTGEPTRPYGTENAPKKQHDKHTFDIYQFKHLPLVDRQALFKKMTPEEKRRYGEP